MLRDSLPAITQYPNPVTKANNAKQRAPCPCDAGPAKNAKTRSARIDSALTSTPNIPKKWEYSIVKIATPLSIADPSLLYNPPLHLSAMRQEYSIPNAVVKSNIPFCLKTQGIFALASQGYLLRGKDTRQRNSLILNSLVEGCIRNAPLTPRCQEQGRPEGELPEGSPLKGVRSGEGVNSEFPNLLTFSINTDRTRFSPTRRGVSGSYTPGE